MAVRHKEPSIRQLLLDTVKPANLHGGSGITHVYNIPGFPDYLLRVPDQISRDGNFETYLKTTTYLYPAYLCDLNVGQVRLQSTYPFNLENFDQDIQIVSKVEGTPLIEEFYKELDDSSGERTPEDYYKIAWKFIRNLAAIPDEAFLKWMEKVKALTQRGIAVDMNLENILWNETTKEINIIDTLCFPDPYDPDWSPSLSGNNIAALLHSIDFEVEDNRRPGGKLTRHDRLQPNYLGCIKAKKELEGRLSSLAEQAGFTQQAVAKLSKGIQLRTVQQVQELGKLSLEESPEALRRMLKELNKPREPQR